MDTCPHRSNTITGASFTTETRIPHVVCHNMHTREYQIRASLCQRIILRWTLFGSIHSQRMRNEKYLSALARYARLGCGGIAYKAKVCVAALC